MDKETYPGDGDRSEELEFASPRILPTERPESAINLITYEKDTGKATVYLQASSFRPKPSKCSPA